MHFRASPVAVAAVLLTSTFCGAIACPSDHVNAPELRMETTGGLSGVMQPEISAPSELSLASLEAQITSPNWMLLLDHEGESFTFFTDAGVSGFEPIPLATSALDIAGSASSISLEVPASGLVLEDDAAAVLFELHEASYPTTTGSSSAALSESEIAVSGYKDR